MSRILLILGLFACSAGAALAVPTVTLTMKPANYEPLILVPAPDARCVALGESLQLLAYGHDRGVALPQVSLYKLNDKGNPAGDPVSWRLPCPAELLKDARLAKKPNVPLSLVFHPKLPLLYVWQDLTLPLTSPKAPAAVADFDHLLVYDVRKSPPELVVSLCRGKNALYGQHAGPLAISDDGDFLYVPNFRDEKQPIYWYHGRFPLDADGLPRVLDKELPLPARLRELSARNATGTLAPPERSPGDYQHTFPHGGALGTAQSAHLLNRDTILLGGMKCLVTWRPSQKPVALETFPVKHAKASHLAVHPRLPSVYVVKAGTPSLFRAEQIEGRWTLLPIEWNFPNVLTGGIALLPKRNQLAVGGVNRVYVVDLDGEGNARPEALEVDLSNPLVRTLVYSEKFDRLYVAVERPK